MGFPNDERLGVGKCKLDKGGVEGVYWENQQKKRFLEGLNQNSHD